jgi:transposase-like protein
VEAELEEFLLKHAHLKLENGRQRVVRNGYLPAREVQTGIGAVSVHIPRSRDKGNEGIKFTSTLLPPYLRRTKSVEEVLPWL